MRIAFAEPLVGRPLPASQFPDQPLPAQAKKLSPGILVPPPFMDADEYSICAILLEGTLHPTFVIQTGTESAPVAAPYERLPPAQARRCQACYRDSFSAVTLDPPRKHAIAAMDHFSGALGGGKSHFFEKKNGKSGEFRVGAELEARAS